jgi:glycerol-3-phosphate dehydrogenase
MTLARTAGHYGAVLRNSTEVVELTRDADRVTGAELLGTDTGARCRVRAKGVSDGL